jgi:hypothetical protein
MIRQLLNKNRRGVSILEVLFAIMISAIGLMGAIAVFPAALLQTKRGQQSDMTAAAGTISTHTFDAMGMRQPSRWLLPSSNAPTSPVAWPSGMGITAPPAMPTNQNTGQSLIDGQFAFCIDPRFVAANQPPATTGPVAPEATFFPYGQTTSPMVRVTLNNGNPNATPPTPMRVPQAELAFRIEDDLAYDRFTGTFNGIDQSTQQAASLFVRDTARNPLKRESHGHMSWMATLAPKLERRPTGGAFEDRYVLSVVVFYDRPVALQANAGFDVSEWALTVNNLYSSGIGGGDVQLEIPTSGPFTVPATNPDEQLRRLALHRDQWIMLIGSTTVSGRRMPVCRWYRIIDSDDPNGTQLEVTLAGADWELPANETAAVVCQGVVAVFEKTIKLEPRN